MSAEMTTRIALATGLGVLALLLPVAAKPAIAADGTVLATWGESDTVHATAGAGRIAWLRRPKSGPASVEILADGKATAVPIARPRELRRLQIVAGADGRPRFTYARCVKNVCEFDIADIDGRHERRLLKRGSLAWVAGSSLLARAAKGWGVSTIGSTKPPRVLRKLPPGRDWAFNGSAIAAVKDATVADDGELDLSVTSLGGKQRTLLTRTYGLAGGLTLSTVGLTATTAYALEVPFEEIGGPAKLWEVPLAGGKRLTAALPGDVHEVTTPVNGSAAVSRCMFADEVTNTVSCQLELRSLKWRTPSVDRMALTTRAH